VFDIYYAILDLLIILNYLLKYLFIHVNLVDSLYFHLLWE